MTYWHMQLHPNEKNWGREIDLLKEKALIGLGEWEDGQSQINQFKHEMQIGDIVLIKRGAIPIALTQVIGDAEESTSGGLDWFEHRRKIKVLEFALERRFSDFPQPRKTLQKSITKSSASYRYIDNWYKILFPEENTDKGMKISRIEIENYKMFKNFTISFQKGTEILPVIVLAGTNGSGKTTLLEYINNYIVGHSKTQNNSFIKIHYKESSKNLIEKIDYQTLANNSSFLEQYFNIHLEYLPTNTHSNLDKIETAIINHLNKLVWNNHESVEDAYNDIKENLKDIFSGLPNFNIDFNSLQDGKKVTFQNKHLETFILGDLSTGQKTLFTKILYLYLNDVRDKVVLIDEPELSLHPSWQSSIFKIYENFAKENNCQVILATHSPHIIANTPHKYLRLLVEEDGKIVAKALDSTPLDRDLNTIIKTVMGADYIPKWLEEKHFAYRELCENGKESSEEAQKLKSEILEYESPNSSFFQGLAFDMELMG